MFKALHCYYHDKRSDFIEALKKSVKLHIDDNLIHKKPSLVVAEYDGTIQSFRIACGNIDIKEYGMYSIHKILDCICDEVYNNMNFSQLSAFILSHYGHDLIHLNNTSNLAKTSGYLAILDLSDFVDNVKERNIGDNDIAKSKSRQNETSIQVLQKSKLDLRIINGVIFVAFVLLAYLTSKLNA